MNGLKDMRRVLGALVVPIALLTMAAPAGAVSSRSAKRAVRKAVKSRYDRVEHLVVHCSHGRCRVAFRQAASTCTDRHVRVTRKHHVRGLSPDCVADAQTPAPPATAPPGSPPPPTTGPPPPPPGARRR